MPPRVLLLVACSTPAVLFSMTTKERVKSGWLTGVGGFQPVQPLLEFWRESSISLSLVGEQSVPAGGWSIQQI